MPRPSFVSIPPQAADAFQIAGADGVALALYRLRASRESGPAVLVGHANGLAAGSYLPMLTLLAEQAQVFAFDCRGHGGAEAPLPEPGGPPLAELYGLDKAAADLGAVADAVAARVGGAPLFYAAHSQSGVNALRLAGVLGRHPFAAMILFEPPVMPAPGVGCRALAERIQPRMAANARDRRARWPGPEALAESLSRKPAFAACGADSLAAHARGTLRPIRPGEDGGPGEGGYTLCCPPEVEGALFASLIDATTFDGLSAVRVPVTLVGSDPATAPADAWVPRAMADLAARIPDCRTDILPEVGHMMPLEDPAACAARILDMLAAADRANAMQAAAR